MKVVINSKIILDTLRSIESVTKTDHCSLSVRKIENIPHLVFSSRGNGITLEKNVRDVHIEDGKGKLTFNIGVLRGLLNKRDKITLSYNKDSSLLEFSNSAGYVGKIAVLPYEDINFDDYIQDSIHLPTKVYDTLIEGISAISINSMYGDNSMSAIVDIKGTTMKLAAYDQFHMAYVCINDKFPKNKSHIHFTLPITVFSTLNQVAGGSNYSLSVSDVLITASNPVFRISMPLLQTKQELDLNQVVGLLKDIPKEPKHSLTVKSDALQTILENTLAIAETNSPVTLEKGKDNKSVILSLKNNFGSVSEKLAVEGKLKWEGDATFNLNPTILIDLLSNINADILKINLTDSLLSMCIEKDSVNSYYMCSLL